MHRVAFHTLGCKVNQYDTFAMMAQFQQAGYTVVDFGEAADVYVLNTCTVTGTGDKKSMQLTRRIRREHPLAELVLCGCLAQRQGEQLLATGARLILGTQRRGEVVALLEQAIRDNVQVCAVDHLTRSTPFEPLEISSQGEHTRAILKIQEGCSNRCTYCIIPSVRGPVRSRPINAIKQEVERFSLAGFQEIVVTGIHLTSYGVDLPERPGLEKAVEVIAANPGVLRIRLGSLEPVVATAQFAASLQATGKVCPQFHLALQSGSDTVLDRMRRRYRREEFLQGVANLRQAFPRCAITTDIIAGFPGETEEEFQETVHMIHQVQFSRIHCFPYSPRVGTPAAAMPGQLPKAEMDRRMGILLDLSREYAAAYQKTWLGETVDVIAEIWEDGYLAGYTPEYLSVRTSGPEGLTGQTVRVRITHVEGDEMTGDMIS